MSDNSTFAEPPPVVEVSQQRKALEKRVIYVLTVYALILILIGLTTIPLQWELALLESIAGVGSSVERMWPGLARWVSQVDEAVTVAYGTYPLLQYGTDWLAFAHIVIGIAFLGAARRPAENKWLVEWGMITCVLVIPTSLIFGELRDIPFFWRLIDSSFGIVGIIPLWYIRRSIHKLLIL